MSAEWYKEQPSNRNFLNPIGYLLKLEKFEGVDFFCQTANVPDVAMPNIEISSQFRNLPIVPGGGVTFGDFTVRFIVDEDLKNYNSIHKWMRDNGNADQMARTTPEADIYTNGQLHIVRAGGIERVAHDRARARCVVVTEIPFPRNDFEIVRNR